MQPEDTLLTEPEARRRLLEAMQLPSPCTLPLQEAVGRIAGEDLSATIPLPGFDNSQMDGYAVQAGSASEGALLRVVGEQAAGVRCEELRVGPGEAIRIFTGAPLPPGADAVVMQEDVEVLESGEIRVLDAVEDGEFIRPKGADLCEGQAILRAGERLTAARIGLLASQGIDRVRAHPTPAVSVITTGDELRPPGETLEPGMIYNSNGPMLEALLREVGVSQIATVHAPDEPHQLADAIAKALDETDFCLIAGGVSVGERDYVREVLQGIGVETDFWKVRVKPGKPFLFGRRGEGLVFGLPGNPVSSYVTFLLFVLPALKRWCGEVVDPEALPLESAHGRLSEELANPGDRPHYIRGILEGGGDGATFRPVGMQQSHALSGLSRANALFRLEEGANWRGGDGIVVFRLPGAGGMDSG